MAITNEALAERIVGLGELLGAKIEAVDDKVIALNEKVAIQNGRVTTNEQAITAMTIRQQTLKEVANEDREHNREAQEVSWTRWQKLLGAGGIVCAALAGAGGLVELLSH